MRLLDLIELDYGSADAVSALPVGKTTFTFPLKGGLANWVVLVFQKASWLILASLGLVGGAWLLAARCGG